MMTMVMIMKKMILIHLRGSVYITIVITTDSINNDNDNNHNHNHNNRQQGGIYYQYVITVMAQWQLYMWYFVII